MPVRPAAAPRPRRGSAARKTGLALLAAVAAWLACSSSHAPAFAEGGVLGCLDEALTQIAPLQQQVEAGKIVPKFGDRAQEIVMKACSKAGTAAPELEQALDGVLQSLFLKQAALLRKQVAQTYEGTKASVDAARRADEQFLASAQDLVRPGSGWSLDYERSTLQETVKGGLQRTAALTEERARAAQVQQSTIDVISKLQEQMEQLAMKVQSARGGGSPWVLSSSYRIPNTPLQVVGRYEQGRANVELNITPEKNPLNTDESFVEGIGPANIGVSFNLGL